MGDGRHIVVSATNKMGGALLEEGKQTLRTILGSGDLTYRGKIDSLSCLERGVPAECDCSFTGLHGERWAGGDEPDPRRARW